MRIWRHLTIKNFALPFYCNFQYFTVPRPRSFKKIYLSVFTIAENILGIPILELIELLCNSNHERTAFFLRQPDIFPIIANCFYNHFKMPKINFDQLANNFQHLNPDSIAAVTSPPFPMTTNAETQSSLPTNPLDMEDIGSPRQKSSLPVNPLDLAVIGFPRQHTSLPSHPVHNINPLAPGSNSLDVLLRGIKWMARRTTNFNL